MILSGEAWWRSTMLKEHNGLTISYILAPRYRALFEMGIVLMKKFEGAHEKSVFISCPIVRCQRIYLPVQ